MERIQNTDQPLSSLTGIRKMISYDDNATNVKYQSKTKLEGLNNMLLSRQNNINQVRLIEKDIYNNIISKLQRVLSKRFNLSEQDYILLVDKYSLKNSELSRNKIMEMINYLNIQNKYSINNVKTKKLYSDVIKRQEEINHIRATPSYGNMIITPDCEANIPYLDKKSNKQNLEERLQEMQLERDSTTSMPNMIKQPVINIPNPKLKDININETIHKRAPNINVQNDSSILNEYSVNTTQDFNIETKIDNIEYNSKIPEYNSKIPEYDTDDTKPKLVITNINQNDNTSSNIENSLHQIVEDLKRSNLYNSANTVVNKETYTLNLMANIISSKSTLNSTSKQLEFNVSYNNKNVIENVSNVEFVSCFVNKNFYEKNHFKN